MRNFDHPREINESIKPHADFRELRPEQFWGADVQFENLTTDEFAAYLGKAAKELNFTYTGYIKSDGSSFVYHFSRYPRRAYGPVAPIDAHKNALTKLVEKLGTAATKIQEESLSERPRYRVLLGLQEGYAESRKQSILKEIELGKIDNINTALSELENRVGNLSQFGISVNDIRSMPELVEILKSKIVSQEHTSSEVRSIVGDRYDIGQVKILTVGPWGLYNEPAVLIEGEPSQFTQVYNLAAQFHQARIAVEDLHTGQARMVETEYCEDPDKE